MLKQVAEVLRDSCRESDLVFRFGGDEFAVLLPQTGLTGARTVAEKIQCRCRLADHGRPSRPST